MPCTAARIILPMRILQLLIVFVFSGFGFFSVPQSAPVVMPPFTAATIARLQSAEHVIDMSNAIDGGRCTAEAVGPHWLLTAAHCYVVSPEIKVDGEKRKIVAMVSDDNDHMLVRVEGVNFASWLSISQRDFEDGQQVAVLGNPGHSRNVLRFGTFQKSERDEGEDGKERSMLWFQMFGAPGDSGAAMVDPSGAIVGVVTGGLVKDAETFTYPLNFQTADLAKLNLL